MPLEFKDQPVEWDAVALSNTTLTNTIDGITHTYGAWIPIESLDDEKAALRICMDRMIEVLEKTNGRLEEAKFVTKPPITLDEDPLRQRGFVAWKMGYKIKENKDE